MVSRDDAMIRQTSLVQRESDNFTWWERFAKDSYAAFERAAQQKNQAEARMKNERATFRRLFGDDAYEEHCE